MSSRPKSPTVPPKVLIVVGSGGIEPWTSIERLGQEPTWGHKSVPGVEIIWMEPDPRRDSAWFVKRLEAFAARRFEAFRTRYNLRDMRGAKDFLLSWGLNRLVRWVIGRPAERPRQLGVERRIRFPYPSSYHLAPLRINAYLRYAFEQFEFDYLLRVSSTCYVDIPQLMRFLSKAPNDSLYAGTLYTKRKVRFVGGSAILFSRDVIGKLLANEESMRLDVHEDVSYGELLGRLDIAEPTHVGRVDAHGQSFEQVVKAPSSTGEPFVYRCKVAEDWTDAAEPVVSLMAKVHTAILARDGELSPH